MKVKLWLATLSLMVLMACDNHQENILGASMAPQIDEAVPADNGTDAEIINRFFRQAERTKNGCVIRLTKTEYDLKGQNIILPQMVGEVKRKKFIINLGGAMIRNGGFIDTVSNWDVYHNKNTYRSFFIENGEFNNADVGLQIYGAQMNELNNIVFAGCRVGAKLGLCLQTNIQNIEENQCRDTGLYIGLAQGPGCDASNSASNNTILNNYRSFGSGRGISLIFDKVSGCKANTLTNEGAGSDVFLLVNGQGSNFMKLFSASGIHVETVNKISAIKAVCYGNSLFTFDGVYAQKANLLIDGYGTGQITVSNTCYYPMGMKFKHNGADDAPLWWHFVNNVRYGRLPYSDKYYWQGTIPRPFAKGQENCNAGSARLKETILIKE